MVNAQRVKQQCRPGQWVRLHHKSKGIIIVKVNAVTETGRDDRVDDVMIQAIIPTANGSGQEHVQTATYVNAANAKRPWPVRIMGLRPSKITQIEPATEDEVAHMQHSLDEYEAVKNRVPNQKAPTIISPSGSASPPPVAEMPAPQPPIPPQQSEGKFRTVFKRILRRK